MVDDVSQRKKNKAEPSPKEYIRAESSAFFAAAVNVSQSHFAYSSCSWDVFAYELLSNQLRALRLLLGQFSSGQRQPIIRRALRLHSWDVFAYESLPNPLRPVSLPLGRLSKIIQDVDWAVKGLNYILWFIHKKSTLYPQAGKGAFARFSRLLGAEKNSFKKSYTQAAATPSPARSCAWGTGCRCPPRGSGASMP